MIGKIEEILVCEKAGQAMLNLQEAALIQGKGIEGDRYFLKAGTFSEALEKNGDFEVTMIEQEEVNSFNHETGLGYEASAFRRNLVTSGIRLNELVGKEFSVGDARLFGVRLCEPCGYLAGLLGESVMDHMVHKAGLRAVIRKSGRVAVGADIVPC